MYSKDIFVGGNLIARSISFQQQREYQPQQLPHMLHMQLAEGSQQQQQATLDLWAMG